MRKCSLLSKLAPSFKKHAVSTHMHTAHPPTCTQHTRPPTVPVVWETWAADLAESSITYFSDFAVEKYRTVSVGVPNTDIGECVSVCVCVCECVLCDGWCRTLWENGGHFTSVCA